MKIGKYKKRVNDKKSIQIIRKAGANYAGK